MREFFELQDLADHDCIDPRAERLEVFEPIRMQTTWLTIFRCCNQIFSEAWPHIEFDTPPLFPALLTRVEAA